MDRWYLFGLQLASTLRCRRVRMPEGVGGLPERGRDQSHTSMCAQLAATGEHLTKSRSWLMQVARHVPSMPLSHRSSSSLISTSGATRSRTLSLTTTRS
eukprot:3069522-Pyramimonas_sp.AAC.1